MGSAVQHRFSAEDRRNQILDVAKRLFAKKGYEGTTTREIANAARVNEAIIFRHFPTKEELYWAVIDATCRATDAHRQMRERLERGGDVRETLRGLAESILDRRSKDPTLTRLLFFSALENHALSSRFFEHYVANFYSTLADYVQTQIDAGVFRQCDALLAARAFLGTIVYHSLIEVLFGGGTPKLKDAGHHAVAAQLTDFWLDGVIANCGTETEKSEG